jgi:arsenical resistance protein ArsH
VLPQAPAELSVPDYQPFCLVDEAAERDWVQHLELDTARSTADATAEDPLKVLVLYGSLRQRSFSKLLAYEFSR